MAWMLSQEGVLPEQDFVLFPMWDGFKPAVSLMLNAVILPGKLSKMSGKILMFLKHSETLIILKASAVFVNTREFVADAAPVPMKQRAIILQKNRYVPISPIKSNRVEH